MTQTMFAVTFTGADATAAPVDISVAGVLTGDYIVRVCDQNSNVSYYSNFPICEVLSDGKIRQNAGDLRNTVISALMCRVPIGAQNATLAASSATLTKTSDVALSQVAGLSLALATGTYRVRGYLHGAAAASGGLVAEFIASNGLVLTSALLTGWNYNGATLNAVTTINGLAADVSGSAAAYTDLIIEGTVVVGTPGTINMQAAQHTSNATPTTVVAGSYLDIVKIS